MRRFERDATSSRPVSRRLEQQGGRIDWRHCGEAARLCVRVDRKAPTYGEKADYYVVAGILSRMDWPDLVDGPTARRGLSLRCADVRRRLLCRGWCDANRGSITSAVVCWRRGGQAQRRSARLKKCARVSC